MTDFRARGGLDSRLIWRARIEVPDSWVLVGVEFRVQASKGLRLPASAGEVKGMRSSLPSPLHLTVPRALWAPECRCASGTFSRRKGFLRPERKCREAHRQDVHLPALCREDPPPPWAPRHSPGDLPTPQDPFRIQNSFSGSNRDSPTDTLLWTPGVNNSRRVLLLQVLIALPALPISASHQHSVDPAHTPRRPAPPAGSAPSPALSLGLPQVVTRPLRSAWVLQGSARFLLSEPFRPRASLPQSPSLQA